MLNNPITTSDDVPDEILEPTRALLEIHPPTNPKILLRIAEWWYDNGRGVNDPAYRYAIRWLDYTANDAIITTGACDDLTLFSELRDYLRELDGAEILEAE